MPEVAADPQGRFTLPVPSGWSAADEGTAVTLTGPEGGVEIHVAAFDRDTPEDLVAAM